MKTVFIIMGEVIHVLNIMKCMDSDIMCIMLYGTPHIARTRSKFVYVCGEYNIDLLKMNSNNDYCLFYENVLSSSFAPKITLPTRICDTTSTLIDNVYTNVIERSTHVAS